MKKHKREHAKKIIAETQAAASGELYLQVIMSTYLIQLNFHTAARQAQEAAERFIVENFTTRQTEGQSAPIIEDPMEVDGIESTRKFVSFN